MQIKLVKKIFALLFLTFGLFACKEDEQATPMFSQGIAVGEARLYNIDGRELIISVIDIEDSRCPTDVVCIWAGTNIVSFTLQSKQNRTNEKSLCSNCEGYNSDYPSSSLVFDQYKITLIDTKPYNSAAVQNASKNAYFKIELLP